jgi:hypothetical protein
MIQSGNYIYTILVIFVPLIIAIIWFIYDALKASEKKEKEKKASEFLEPLSEEKMIEFIKPYQQVALEVISAYIFKLELEKYENELKPIKENLPPQQYTEMIESFSGNYENLVERSLNRLINTGRIKGYIRLFESKLHYFALEPTLD